jgi:hypothetical protein
MVTVDELRKDALDGKFGTYPQEMPITGASYIYQTTQFPGTDTKYHNHYVLLRVGSYFGACCHMPEQLEMVAAAELSGIPLSQGIGDDRLPVGIAALDAYFGNLYPHQDCCQEIVTIPAGTPIARADYRDALISRIAGIRKGERVALIGVVNPLVKGSRDAGGICLPCDLQMKKTQWGDVVEEDMDVVLAQADSVISTAMTLGNGTFDRLCGIVRKRNIPLTVYGQTGSAVVARFLSKGVTTLLAEPFPFTQFCAEASRLFIYTSCP